MMRERVSSSSGAVPDVELLQVGVGEGEHLGEEGVEPHVVGELPAEVNALLLGHLPEALDRPREHGVQPVLRRLGVEVDPGEGFDVRLGVHRKRGEARLDLVKEVRVGRLRQQRRLVVRFKGRRDLVRLVREVEDHRALLLRVVRTVEPRERLHRVDAAELLVHVHGVEQWLVEAGLELVGHDQESVLGTLEGLGGLRLREAVHAGLGV
jgi:hypothetical protein